MKTYYANQLNVNHDPDNPSIEVVYKSEADKILGYFKEYGRHKSGCKYFAENNCSCGFFQALISVNIPKITEEELRDLEDTS